MPFLPDAIWLYSVLRSLAKQLGTTYHNIPVTNATRSHNIQLARYLDIVGKYTSDLRLHQHNLFGAIHFFQLDFYELLRHSLNLPPHKCRFNRQRAMPTIHENT